MADLIKLLAMAVGFAALTATLQGCGPQPRATTTTMTTTTTTGTPKRSPGGDPAEIAKLLNDAYYGFSNDTKDPMDPKAPMGVTMNLPSDQTSFFKNIFCAEYNNPKGKTGCSQGRCDCRFSAALYNHLMLITEGFTLMDILKRRTAIVFNQTLVENYLSRCFYIWDGASNNKYNVGCGNGAGGDCSSRNSAFHNICPSTNKTCTAQDQESKDGLCQQFGGLHPMPVAHSAGYQCSFPGPAIDYHEQQGWQPTDSREHLREMLTFRTKNQQGNDEGTLKTKMWNEVVLDVRLLMPRIWEDPALVIPAFVYWKDDPIAKANAKTMRDDFCAEYGLDQKIPVLALDWKATTLKKEPIYLALPEDNEQEVVI
eukprot:CAMPEP_0172683196 /NCGR_PEP_ID=MMETSP1074-20121228/18692_1 /TAXON_ID=2916 /ORGANISM="Ceratium fusus, Strain PA161109" /LENGTH=368 /DNA_ID=CAMNT_0013502011 /DNA_START=26 /DNA_END=1132 /DNA_ORIENTATION=+